MLYDQRVPFLLLDLDVLDLRVQFTDILCYILVFLGVFGNVLGLFIFSTCRRTWQISTIYVYLATTSSIINLFCVIRYALILHSKSQYVLRQLVGHVWIACKLYEFTFSFRLISSWITLFWMFERVTCVSKRLRSIFYRWNTSKIKFIIPIILIIIILVCVLGPSLYMYEPQMFGNKSRNSSTDMIINYCGLSSKASIKWQKYFNDMHFGPNHYTIRCLFSELIPAGTIILFNGYIMCHLFQTSRRFSQSIGNKTPKERRRITSWMNIVLILHSTLFLSSLITHIVGHLLSVEAHETWWILLAVLGNCSLNFYIYCLSGSAFRRKINRGIQQLTTVILYKLQIPKQRRYNLNNEYRRYKCDQPAEINQPEIYRPKHDKRSIPINSSIRISKIESSV